MRHFKDIVVKTTELASIECDCCGTIIDAENVFEIQEFLTVNFCGGYGSVFGDMTHIRGDFCQYCVKQLLGKYLKEIDTEKGELL